MDSDPATLIVQSAMEADMLRRHLLALAVCGIAVHIPSEVYEQLKIERGKFAAKAWIRPFTAHNGKLGYNFNKNETKYVQADTRQFANSIYA